MQSVAAFYRFAPIADPLAARAGLARGLAALGLKGSVIVAGEGVNGTLAGGAEALALGLGEIEAVAGRLRVNRSEAETAPFRRLIVKAKAEIVTMGDGGADPGVTVGIHVAPRDWNALIDAHDVAVIDTRNAYEVAIGTFEGAIDPGIATFRDFPGWWAENAAAFRGKRVAMFCTGGIRCEKATSHALQHGAVEVFHLDGGILRYLQDIPPEESLWQGECFVFDDRVAVGPGCAPGQARMCRACGHPLPAGVACGCGDAG
jgi:UPF0176 protein